jgi:hypothetical protein
LPRGRQLITLEDAGTYITKLPKAEHIAPEWQAAMECLILVVEKNGPTMMAWIDMGAAFWINRFGLVLTCFGPQWPFRTEYENLVSYLH